MALYGKKLHIRKNGVVTDINLWTETAEAGTPALHIRDGVNLVHARLGEVTDGLASDLRVRKDNVVYAVLKNRWVTINIVQSANQTITVTVGEKTYTESFSVPYGTAYTATITAAAGFAPGALSSSGGTAQGDVTISATAASMSTPTGQYETMPENGFIFTVPGGVYVLKLMIWENFYKWVGVTPGHVIKIFRERDINGSKNIPVSDWLRVDNTSNGRKWTFEVESNPQIEPTEREEDGVVISYGPEINVHGGTDGSV